MTEQTPDSRLVRAYNDMMQAIRDVFDRADAETSDLSLTQALQQASDRVVELGELSAAEARQISAFIKRDINDAAEYLMESSAEFSDWLLLDIDIVERKIVDLFLSVADKTRLELEQLKQHNTEQARYHTGEITGPGTLECLHCGNHIACTATSVIFRCPECGHDEFKRPQVRRLSGHDSVD